MFTFTFTFDMLSCYESDFVLKKINAFKIRFWVVDAVFFRSSIPCFDDLICFSNDALCFVNEDLPCEFVLIAT